jgi:Tol biopolymer transport system component/DNA-binding winged helix-turn-helix (wHTH) protein
MEQDFYVGSWQIQPCLNRIVEPENGRVHQVEPKIMQVLLCLAAEAGQPVTRDQLMDTVWKGTFVLERVLTRAISELRKIFRDDPKNPAVIETIFTRGYRLIAPIGHAPMPSDRTEESSGQAAPASRANRPKSRKVWFSSLGLLALMLGAWLVQNRMEARSVDFSEAFAVRPFTTYNSWEYDPALSPDGTQVAFVWAGPERKSWDIYIKPVDDGAPLRFTKEGGTHGSPTWSPDGKTLAYYRYDRKKGHSTLYSRSISRGPERWLTSCNAKYPDLDWSPDGRWLAYYESKPGASVRHIVLLSMEDLEKRVLTHPPAHIWGDHSVSFSPDGENLAFTRSISEGQQDIYLISLDDENGGRLTFQNRNVRGHDWTTDGKSIIFSSNLRGYFELWQLEVSAPDKSPRHLVAGRNVTNPTVREGRLVATEWRSDTNIWELTLQSQESANGNSTTNGAATAAAPLISSTRWDLNPAISPDGERLAFASNRSGSYEIWVSESDGENPMQLTSFEGPYVSTPRWSPDGGWLVFEARPNGNADLYAIICDGGDARPLTTSAHDDLAPTFSPKGEWIFFASSRKDGWQIWKLPANGGRAIQITRQGGFAAQVSHDGRTLLFTKQDTSGVWQLPIEGGAETWIFGEVESTDWGSWSPVENGVYFFRRADYPVPDTLAFFDFATRDVRMIHTSKRVPESDVALAVSRDGRRILYGQLDYRERDLVMVQGLFR